MAFNTASGRQIRAGVLEDSHFSSDPLKKLSESKVNIDWNTRGDEILSKKLVVDYVQKNGKAVSAASSSVVVTADISASPAATTADKGVVVANGSNKVIIRDSVTGDPLIGTAGKEVYGTITHNGVDYVISFFSKDGTGTEVAHTIVDATVIDYQFPQRFDFLTVAETFAANEKFVDGASDVSARLDLEQIVKDAFGAGYTLDHDGTANRGKTLAQEITDETSGVTNTSVRAKDVIDEVVTARNGKADLNTELAAIRQSVSDEATARGNADTQIYTDFADVANGKGASLVGVEDAGAKFTATNVEGVLAELQANIEAEATARDNADTQHATDLASNANGKGASLIGIEDAGAKFTATTVEGALVEIEGRVVSAEAGATEVVNTHSREAASANNYFAAKTGASEYVSLEDRIVDVESVVDAKAKVADDVALEVQNARGGEANLDTRLDNIETELASVHRHYAEDKQVLAGDPLIGSSSYTLQSADKFTVGNKSLQVFVNGFLQMAGVHYTETADPGDATLGVGVNFTPELIAEGDVIQLRWAK